MLNKRSSKIVQPVVSADISDETGTAENIDYGNGILAKIRQRWWVVAILGALSLGVLGSTLKYLDEDAKAQLAKRNAATQLYPYQEPVLNSVNPFLSAPLPTPAPQLSKEYIYAGSRMLAVEDANANVAPPTDLAIWRPSTGYWWGLGGPGSNQVAQNWGLAGDIPVPGDFDADGKTDFSVFRPNTGNHTGTWYVLFSTTGSYSATQFGTDTDKPVPADYDGDGKTDIAVFRPSNSTWYILRSSDGGVTYINFGYATDIPSVADYDGDGKADVGVWRNSNNTFYSENSSNQSVQSVVFSQTSTQPVSGDYDGDGKADYAIRNGAEWIVRYSSTGTIQSPITWQQSGDKAVPNDYDGDGKMDIAVWRDSNGNWYIRNSADNSTRTVSWGLSGDIPVPALYRR